MQKGAAGAGFVALGSLAGCSGGDSGDDGTPTGDETSTGDGTPTGGETETPGGDVPGTGSGLDPASVIPAQAGAVVSVDMQAMLDDNDLRDVVNMGLSELASFGQGSTFPEDVESAIEMAREEVDLDPTGFNEGLLFMEVESSGTDEDYAGMVMETDWSEDELIGVLDSMGISEPEQSEYGGKTIYSAPDSDDSGMAVLSDGQYAIGSMDVIEDVVDVSNGDGEAVAGELATLYNDATDGHMEFATVVPDDALTAEDFSTDEITIESVGEIEYMSGSVYKTDSTYGVETSMWAGDAASDLKEDIDAALTLVPQFDDVEDELATRIEEIQVETSGQTVTMSYEEDIAEVKSYAEEYVNQLVVLLMLGAGGSFSPSTTV